MSAQPKDIHFVIPYELTDDEMTFVTEEVKQGYLTHIKLTNKDSQIYGFAYIYEDAKICGSIVNDMLYKYIFLKSRTTL